jgi:ABC-type transport system involved in cytochrome c biogenesis permease component
VTFAILFGLTSVSLFASIGRQAQTYAPADLIAGAVLWLAALLALLLITTPSSAGHYRARRDTGGTCDDGPMMPMRASWN